MNTLEDLNKIAEQKNVVRKAAYLHLKDFINHTFTSFIPSHLAPYVTVINASDEHVEIGVSLPNVERGHSFDMYFYTPWGEKKRTLKMNFGCFGSFSQDDIVAVKYCEALSCFAANLATIENKLLASDEGKKAFAEYKNARDDAWRAAENVKTLENEIAENARQAKVQEIEKQFVVGAKLRVGINWNNSPAYDEIVRVTNKLIFFKNDYGTSTKKSYAIDQILNKKWEFAEVE